MEGKCGIFLAGGKEGFSSGGGEDVGHLFERVLTWMVRCLRRTLLYADTLCPRLRTTPERSQLLQHRSGILYRSQNNESGFNLKFQEGREPWGFLRWGLRAGGTARFNNRVLDDEHSRKPDSFLCMNLIGASSLVSLAWERQRERERERERERDILRSCAWRNVQGWLKI